MEFEFVRPEIRLHVTRFRDAYLGIGVALVGVYLALIGLGIVPMVGMSLAIAGALLTFSGIQRGRFRTVGQGPGVVQVIEGQVTYFGPTLGGTIALDNLVKVELMAGADGRRTWVLRDASQTTLYIPVDAEGAEALFDSFASLERLKIEKMLGQLAALDHGSVTIWQAPRPVLH